MRAWTNYVLHLGNTTTDRVESTHEKLEKYLMYSKENLARGWDAIQYMLQLQFHEIQIYFRRSCTAMKHRYRGNLFYSNLEYMVSRVGLNCVVSIIRSVVV